MLSDRIQKTARGFSIIKDGESEDGRKAFYGIYMLKDAPDFKPELVEAAYWMPMSDSEIQISAPGCFVYAVEKQNDKIVDETRFYWSAASSKPTMTISVDAANKKYGKQAYVIDIKWNGEPINNEYLFLESTRGERFRFLRKIIGGNGKTEERYIYIVPEGDDPDNYSVSVLPQLKEKFNVVIE